MSVIVCVRVVIVVVVCVFDTQEAINKEGISWQPTKHPPPHPLSAVWERVPEMGPANSLGTPTS